MRPIAILIIVSLFSCSQRETDSHLQQSKSDSTVYYLEQIAQLSKVTGDNSFPIQYLTNDSLIQTFLRDKLNTLKKDRANQQKFLRAINEPDISEDSIKYDCYRLTWIRAFDQFVYVIRIQNDNNQIKITTKKIKPASEKSPNAKDALEMVDSSEKVLDEEEWNYLAELIRNTYFWNMTDDFSDVGYDGSWWTLEGVKQSDQQKPFQYNKVTRWTPHNNSFRSTCEYILKLTGQNYGVIY